MSTLNTSTLASMSKEAFHAYINKVTVKDLHAKCAPEVLARFNNSFEHQQNVEKLLSENILLSSV